jgi:glycosyltransferase involved in cell wall biosynthesis
MFSDLGGFWPMEHPLPPSDRTLMLFDLSVRGHHPNYIQQLLLHRSDQPRFKTLHVVVSPNFLQEHPEVVALAQSQGEAVQFVAISNAEQNSLLTSKSAIARNLKNFQEWRLCCQYAKKLEVDHCLVMYLDTYFLAIAAGLRPSCAFSGIYFRPTFHYGSFQAHANTPLDRKAKLQRGWEQWILDRVLHSPRTATLFCLDPFVEPFCKSGKGPGQIRFLPDPVDLTGFQQPEGNLQELRSQLGVEPHRQICLTFGALTTRKGVYQLLDAVAQLSEQDCAQLCLLFVGESKIKAELEERIQTLCAQKPVQVVRRYEFIADAEIPPYFKAADIISALYQHHVGSSGILLLAAAAQKPVLGTDYGLMGELIRRYQLGLAVDSTQPAAIAVGFQQLLTQDPQQISNPAVMGSWAAENSAENYAATIFGLLSA